MEDENSVADSIEDQNNSIDRLEDEIIDHPSASEGPAQFSDESFQHKLNERANQIQQGGGWSGADPNDPNPDQNSSTASYQFSYTKPNLLYEYADYGDLSQELDQWFVSSDFALIGLDFLKTIDLKSLDLESVPLISSINLWQPSDWLDSLVYYALGAYGDTPKQADHILKITTNCEALMSSASFPVVVGLLGAALNEVIEPNAENITREYTKVFTSNYFKLQTVVYFVLNVALASTNFLGTIFPVLMESDLLTKVVQLTETWKLRSSPQLRLRNCLLLHWKLMLVEFGTSEQLAKVDAFLVKKYDVKNKERKSKANMQLTCSRVDYFTFAEDSRDKYPQGQQSSDNLFQDPKRSEADDESTLSSSFSSSLALSQEKESFMAMRENSTSISNSIEVPRTNKSHSLYGSLPGQTVHIATPVPSPPTTPSEFMSGGEKVRKSYHVNQGLPFVYPFEESQRVPEAINEASDLIEEGVYESYSAKRIGHERKLLLAKERGIASADIHTHDPREVPLKTSVDDASVSRSLDRVEKYYRKTLKHLRAFVDVLLGVLRTSKIDISLRDLERELDPESSFTGRFGSEHTRNSKIFGMIYHQLDVLRAKEITLKAVSAIMVLTLRWFKVSHPMKAIYFNSLLFDARFMSVFAEFLGDSFNNSALQNFASENKVMQTYDVTSSQNRLMNPSVSVAQLGFFEACQGLPEYCPQKYALVNKTPIGKLPQNPNDANISTVSISEFNHDFCFILINLLNVTNKILVKNISQRVFAFNETKSTDLLKMLLLNYVNEDLRKPILRIFKKITPYQGRKWRALNMDVISLVYLHMKLSLRDNWLSGKDLENEFKDSLEQEVSLRSFLQFYNVRNYSEEMKSLGYASRM
ncbi:hypothetical protein OXX80_003188 [Metschnikowia pulcherrima]